MPLIALRLGWLALLLAATACHRAADVQPATLTGGAWRLTVMSGGYGGAVTTLPAGQQPIFQFRPDSTFGQYLNGQLQSAGTYRLRYLAERPGLPDTTRVLLLQASPSGLPLPYSGYITCLSATRLRTTTGAGCAFDCQYVRVASTAAGGQ